MSDKRPASEFPSALKWINTHTPPTLAALSGKAVLLHFFNGADLNCQRDSRMVKQLVGQFDDSLAAIGVHCPKYSQQRDPAAVLKAINAWHLRYAVAHDIDHAVWHAYGIQAWPSTVLIDPWGQVAGTWVGAGHGQAIEQQVQSVLDEAVTADQLSFGSVEAVGRGEPPMALSFPQGILATERYLYVSDTGHNRVVEIKPDGRINRQFGSGNPGFWDGTNTDAGLRDPRGLCLLGEYLYVADTGNHAIRRIHVTTGEVTTVGGNGKHGIEVANKPVAATAISLNSPTDVTAITDNLHIAMAGQNQVWNLDLGANTLQTLSGNGSQDLVDGKAHACAFNQPMGIAGSGQRSFVADSGNSAIRQVRHADFFAKTLVGRGPWTFGDEDGNTEVTRLQYPCGIDTDKRGVLIWIADSYNNRLKVLDMRKVEMKTLRFRYRFRNPTALTLYRKTLYVANTDAHEIVKVDLTNGECQAIAVAETEGFV